MKKKLSNIVRVAFLSGLVAACGSGDSDRQLRLFGDEAPAAAEESDEERRLNQLMRITIETQGASATGPWTVTEVDGAGLVTQLWNVCMKNCPAGTAESAVKENVCRADAERCTAERLLELGKNSDATMVYEGIYPHNNARQNALKVHPRSTAAAAGILDAARAVAQNASFWAVMLMQGYNLSPVHGGGVTPGGNYTTFAYGATLKSGSTDGTYYKYAPDLAEKITISVIDKSVNIMMDASYLLAKKSVDAAHWQLGSSDSLPTALRRAVSGTKLSAAAAAHVLVGGSAGLSIRGQAVDSFCSIDLTVSGKLALDALREAAVDPAHVNGSMSTADLVDGLAGTGSVRERLAALRSESRLTKSAAAGGISVLEYLGLRLEHFEEARSYLKQELFAFSSPVKAVAPDPIDAGTITFSRFLATANPPAPRPDAYYSGIARNSLLVRAPNQPSNWPIATNGVYEGPRLPWDLSTFIGHIVTGIEGAAKSSFSSSVGAPLNQLRDLSAALRQAAPTSFTVKSIVGFPTKRDLSLDSAVALSNVRIVEGEDSLDCATTGLLAGRPCVDPPIVAASLSTETDHNPVLVGFKKKYAASVTDATVTFKSNRQYYLVASINVDGSLFGAKGAPLVLAAFPGGVITSLPENRFIDFDYLPEAEKKAAEYLRPNSRSCTRSQVQCDGSFFDERLPLENELASDGDGVEDSWEIYLDRAEQAAVKADEFGNAYLTAIQAELQNTVTEEQQTEDRYRQAEAELETLNQLCGSSVDLAPLMTKLGIDDDPANRNDYTAVGSTSCTTDAACATAAGCTGVGMSCECVIGKCFPVNYSLMDDNVDPDRRLRECLGQETVVDYSALGSSALCVKFNADGGLCSDLWMDPCPVMVANQQECTNKGAAWKYLPSSLNLFTTTTPRYLTEKKPQWHPGGSGCWYQYTSEETAIGAHRFIDVKVWDSYYGPGNPTNPEMPCKNSGNHTSTLETWEGRDVLLVEDWPITSGSPAVTRGRDVYVFFEGCDKSPPLNGDDLVGLPAEVQYWLMERYAECTAVDMQGYLARRVLQRVPAKAVDVVVDYGTSGVFPDLGGEHGEELMRFRAALLRFAEYTKGMTDTVFEMKNDLQQVQQVVKQVGIKSSQAVLDAEVSALEKQKYALMASQLAIQREANVLGAFGAVVGGAATGGPLGAFAGTFEMAQLISANEQLDQSEAILDLESEIADKNIEQAELEQLWQAIEEAKVMAEARASFRRRARSLDGQFTEARAAIEEFEASLASLETKRDSARRAFGRAIRVLTKTSQAAKNYREFLSYDIELKRQSYEEARDSAVRLAFFAKRAIEQRIGMRFSTMRDDLPLVGAPAIWENDICVATGIDFTKLREGQEATPSSQNLPYVWHYVDRLRRTVESYRLQYGFQEGRDTMVLSLKEDVFQSQAECAVPHNNLLTRSQTLRHLDQPDGTGWSTSGCSNCITMTLQDPVADTTAEQRPEANQIDFSAAGQFRQGVSLSAGTYILSWYGPVGNTNGFDLRDSAAVVIAPIETISAASYGAWQRHWRRYNVVADATYYVTLVGTAGSAHKVAGPMLESRTAEVDVSALEPMPYQARDGLVTRSSPTCADNDGAVFRDQNWKYDCMKLCWNGLNTECDEAYAADRCYWEANFPLGQALFELGRVKGTAGFATGNFNYRVDDVAINFVGTTLRSCEEGSGLACYGTGSIPYTLEHRGQFTVRNHLGDDFVASLFNGRIEHARGLATERYLTNPLSSEDTSLLAPYLRQEFRGRPLDGNYVLRVWDEPGVEFERVEDVQLYLAYRYWTRLN